MGVDDVVVDVVEEELGFEEDGEDGFKLAGPEG